MPKKIIGTILASRFLSPDIKWFEIALSEQMEFKPGQYASLRFFGELRYHAFSIASSPKEKGTIELIVKKAGDFTTRMHAAPNGTQFDVLMPMGRFMDGVQGDMVMIAGGVGMTPFLGMVRYARDLGLRDRQYWLFYSCKTRDDVAFEQELRAMGSANPNVHIVLTLTREQPDGWDGELGRFSKEMLLRHRQTLENASFYTCGPNAMVEGVVAALKEAGVPQERIFLESWG